MQQTEWELSHNDSIITKVKPLTVLQLCLKWFVCSALFKIYTAARSSLLKVIIIHRWKFIGN